MSSKFEKANYHAVLMKTVEKTGVKTSEADTIIKAFVESVKEYTGKGFQVTVKDLGKFYSWKKPARKARNPRTGESVDVAEKMVVKFNAANVFITSLEKSINE